MNWTNKPRHTGPHFTDSVECHASTERYVNTGVLSVVSELQLYISLTTELTNWKLRMMLMNKSQDCKISDHSISCQVLRRLKLNFLKSLLNRFIQMFARRYYWPQLPIIIILASSWLSQIDGAPPSYLTWSHWTLWYVEIDAWSVNVTRKAILIQNPMSSMNMRNMSWLMQMNTTLR